MLLVALTLFGYMLTGKRLIRGSDGVTWADEEMIRVDKIFNVVKSKFNGINLRNSLLKIKDGTNIVNLGEGKSKGTHLIHLFANSYNVTYFDSFWAEYIQKKLKNSKATKKSLQIFMVYK